MFTGIQSLLFGKRGHKHKHDDSTDDKSQSDADFVILERRHSDEYDRNTALYPSLDPNQPPPSNLPYAVSPSLPNLRDAVAAENSKDETKVDMLQGVPFVLSSQVLLLDDISNTDLKKIIKSINDIKEVGEDYFLENFFYDYELEHTVSSEFADA